MDNSTTTGPGSARALDRHILAIALPTFATLVSEPLLLLADSAVVGHLGTEPLAALALCSNVLNVLVGLSIFLAYSTTGTVARRLGAGDRLAALSGGLDGLVLAIGVGVVLAVGLELALPWVVGLYGVEPGVATLATTYLRLAALGLPSVLVLLAGTGVLRGLQDARTPLVVVVAANLVNIALNVTLVYGVRLGIAGSALGTLIAQTGAAVVVLVVVVRRARAAGATLAIRPAGVRAVARTGGWLVVRTALLQAAVTTNTLVAAALGAGTQAARHGGGGLWTLLAFDHDAVALAGQALIGSALGSGDVALGRALTRRMLGWGVVSGVAFGLALVVARPAYTGLFTADPAVARLVGQVVLVVALQVPLAGVVYVLDGILIGAGDARYLALAGLVSLALYLPVALVVRHHGAGLVWIWAADAVFMAARAVTLGLRARGSAWTRTGV